MKRALLYSLLIFCIILPVTAEINASGIEWRRNLRLAIKEARLKNRPLMVDFYAIWCGYCRKLRRDVYPAHVVRREAKKFISVTINGERDKRLARRYEVHGYPAILFLDKNGFLLDRLDGLVTGNQLARKMRQVFRRRNLEQNLKSTVRVAPRSVTANYQMGSYYYELRQHSLARNYFVRAWKAKKIDSSDFKREALYNAAVSSMDLRDYRAAIYYWNLYLKYYSTMNTDYVYARHYRGLSLQKIGKIKLAKSDLNYAARNLPSVAERQAARRALAAAKNQ